jgi:type VI secretion system protein ImpL
MMAMVWRCVVALILAAAIWWWGPQLSLGPWRPFASALGRAIGAVFFALLVFVPVLSRLRSWAPSRKRSAAQGDDVPRRRILDTLRRLRQGDLERRPHVWQRVWYRLTRGERRAYGWTLVIGPQGSGKSSLVAMAHGDSVSAEGQSKNASSGSSALAFDIRASDSGVFVDVESRLLERGATEEASQWRQLLRALRRRPCLSAVIVCIDANAWIAASSTARRQLADSLRANLHDVATQAGADIPVHLVATQIDKLAGWPALLAALEEDDLDQGLGIVLNPGRRHANLDELAIAWSRLEQRLHDRVTGIIQHHRFQSRFVSQASLLNAMSELARLRACILEDSRQIVPVMRPGRAPVLASLWLTSAAELELSDPRDGAILRRMLAVTLQAPLRRLGMHSSRPRHTSRWWSPLAWSATAVFAMAATWFLIDRYTWERDYIAKVGLAWQQSSRLALAWQPSSNAMHSPEVGEGLRYMADLLQLGGKTWAPWASPFRQHRRLDATITRALEDHLVRLLWPYAVADVADTLQAELNHSPTAVPDSLRAYLMLTGPAHRDAGALVAWFDRHWDELAPPGRTATDRAAFRFYLQTLFGITDPVRQPVAKPMEELVRQARQVAASQPLPARVIARLQEIHKPMGVPVTLASAAGDGAALGLRRQGEASLTDVAVPSFFTIEAYRQTIDGSVDDAATAVLAESGWLLGEREGNGAGTGTPTYTTSQRLATDARRLYLTEYSRHWSSFLGDVRLRQVATLEDAAQLANYLAEPGSPLMRLVAFATRQTTLRSDDSSSDVDVAPDLSESASLFAQLVTARFESLHRLQGPTGSGALEPLFVAVSDQIAALSSALRMGQVLPHQDGLARLRGQQERLPDPARRVLGDLLSIADTQTLTRSRQTLSADASGLGAGTCRRLVAGRYPLDRNAARDIGLDDFTRVLGPNGAMQAFFDSRLAEYVDTDATSWRARVPEARRIVDGRTLRSFQDADSIRQAFFLQGSFGFRMMIRPVALDPRVLEATLDIDGQVITYAHGMSSPISVQWPGPRRGVSAKLTMRGVDGSEDTLVFEGPWALFRLYDAGQAGPLVNDARELRLATRVGTFTIQLRAATRDFPLWLTALGRFQCPDTYGTSPPEPRR